MCGVGLYDVVTLTSAKKEITVTSNNKTIPVDESNLAYKAAALLMEKAGISGGLTIHLEKHIPVAAGLGGGSSDAAAVLKGMNDCYNLTLSRSELMDLGPEIGADVPFFFFHGTALATGIGERLSSLAISPPFWTVLVTPPFPVSAGWAYSRCELKSSNKSIANSKEIDLLNIGTDLLFNALEYPVMKRFPEIDGIKKLLIKYGAWGSLMSGSGPTVFGIFFEEMKAKEAKNRLLDDHAARKWNVSVAKGLT